MKNAATKSTTKRNATPSAHIIFTKQHVEALALRFPNMRNWSALRTAEVYDNGRAKYVLVKYEAPMMSEGFGGVCGAQEVANFMCDVEEDIAAGFAASIREALYQVASGMIADEIERACKRVQRSVYGSAERELAEKGLGALLAKWSRCFH